MRLYPMCDVLREHRCDLMAKCTEEAKFEFRMNRLELIVLGLMTAN